MVFSVGKVPLTGGYSLKQFISPNNIFIIYLSLHAVLPLLMLQIYRTGITFIYTVRFDGDRGMRVKLSAHKPGLSPPVTFVTDRSKAVLPSFP